MRQLPATESARDVIARKACISCPLARCFLGFFRRVWLSLSLSLVRSESVSLRDCLPPPFKQAQRQMGGSVSGFQGLVVVSRRPSLVVQPLEVRWWRAFLMPLAVPVAERHTGDAAPVTITDR